MLRVCNEKYQGAVRFKNGSMQIQTETNVPKFTGTMYSEAMPARITLGDYILCGQPHEYVSADEKRDINSYMRGILLHIRKCTKSEADEIKCNY
jgi:hypothetical protein